MECNKCDNGMIRETTETGWIANRCDCKTEQFWQQRRQETAAMMKRKIREFEQKAVV